METLPSIEEETEVLSVMIIDDDREILNSLQYALGSYGHQVTLCENGTQAMMRAAMNDFDCIITDFSMPGMDGIELTRRLRDRFPMAIIIGMSLKELGETFLSAGANDFLRKPFAPYELAMMLNGDDILA